MTAASMRPSVDCGILVSLFGSNRRGGGLWLLFGCSFQFHTQKTSAFTSFENAIKVKVIISHFTEN
jgi:hypothetical protein